MDPSTGRPLEGATSATSSPITTSDQETLQRILTQITTLRQDFSVSVESNKTKDRLMDTLHQQLQEQREGLHWHILRPMLMELISLHDELSKNIMALTDKQESAQLLLHFQIIVEEILANNGVERFTNPSPMFVTEEQRAVKAIPTNDPALNNTIAKRLRVGFKYEKRVIRPEWVETYHYSASV